MHKPIREWTVRDVISLRPLTHRYKAARSALVDRRFLAKTGDEAEVAAMRAAVAGKNAAITMAFQDAEVIDWQIRLVRKYLPPLVHVIIDNSPGDSEAAAIRAAAVRNASPYLRLPPNPWTGVHASRSHGQAMNWVWRHVLKPAAPAAFGFLDHDIFPTAPDDPFGALAGLPFHGDIRNREGGGEGWYLWAGYCFFDFAQVQDKRLDFGPHWLVGLDTGGGNWLPLYRHVDRARLPVRPVRDLQAFDDVSQREAYYGWHGTWLHEVGIGGGRAFQRRKREMTARLLAAHLGGG